MMAVDPLSDHSSTLRRRRFAFIQEKLERILRTNGGKLVRYRAEVISIIDTLDALNRDSDMLKKRGHLGDMDVD